MLTYAHVCSRMLTYAHVCSRMLTYDHVCSRVLTCAVKVLLVPAAQATCVTNADICCMLTSAVKVPLVQALTGCQFIVTHLDGRCVSLCVERGNLCVCL